MKPSPTGDRPISDAARQGLREALSGVVLDPAHPGYEAARKVWNGTIDLNFPGYGEGDHDLWKASHGANFERLRTVKARYDPSNLFRMNQNIRPHRADV